MHYVNRPLDGNPFVVSATLGLASLAFPVAAAPGPIPGSPATAISTNVAAKLTVLPAAGDAYRRAQRTCTGVPSLAIRRGSRLWVAWYSGTTPGAKIETCPNAHVIVSTSSDRGRTWSSGLMIDERIGCTYPDARQAPDGTIFLTWDFERSRDQEILLTTFREEDVLAGSPDAVARVKASRRLVSKGGVK